MKDTIHNSPTVPPRFKSWLDVYKSYRRNIHFADREFRLIVDPPIVAFPRGTVQTPSQVFSFTPEYVIKKALEETIELLPSRIDKYHTDPRLARAISISLSIDFDKLPTKD